MAADPAGAPRPAVANHAGSATVAAVATEGRRDGAGAAGPAIAEQQPAGAAIAPGSANVGGESTWPAGPAMTEQQPAISTVAAGPTIPAGSTNPAASAIADQPGGPPVSAGQAARPRIDADSPAGAAVAAVADQ
ncbi:hypothetical protein LAUMK40_05680 [Mycobacterium kansasii]|nr:hypothetical protein LAUMK40_05680 [Mycobacterium kansasii]